MAKVVAVGVLLAAAGVALAVLPWELRMEGDGELWPETRRFVYAETSGTVEELLVDHGEHVKAGQAVAKLKDVELTLSYQARLTELHQAEQEIRGIEAKKAKVPSGRDREALLTDLEGRQSQLRAQLPSLREQVSLLDHQRKRLEVLAPIDGVVVTWDLKQNVLGRRVERGQPLMRIVQDQGAWELEVRMPEKKIGHIAQAEARRAGKPLAVRFILANQPDRVYQGHVKQIATHAEVQEQDNVVMITVALDDKDVPLRAGSEVRAKVECGERALGYVLFHDLAEFVYTHVLF